MSKKFVLPEATQAWLDSPEVSNRPRTNIYTCERCQRQVVTKDVDKGVTPFMIACRATQGCKGAMTSGFYRCDQSREAHFEFYRPETIGQIDRQTLEHLMKGGLLLRPASGISSEVAHDA